MPGLLFKKAIKRGKTGKACLICHVDHLILRSCQHFLCCESAYSFGVIPYSCLKMSVIRRDVKPTSFRDSALSIRDLIFAAISRMGWYTLRGRCGSAYRGGIQRHGLLHWMQNSRDFPASAVLTCRRGGRKCLSFSRRRKTGRHNLHLTAARLPTFPVLSYTYPLHKFFKIG